MVKERPLNNEGEEDKPALWLATVETADENSLKKTKDEDYLEETKYAKEKKIDSLNLKAETEVGMKLKQCDYEAFTINKLPKLAANMLKKWRTNLPSQSQFRRRKRQKQRR